MDVLSDRPTPYPDVNALLAVLLAGVRAILGDGLIGLYLDGSLATGGFDQDSDIDFVAVTRSAVGENDFLALSEMHDRITTLDSPFAFELEGFYVPASALRRGDPRVVRCPNLERGRGERLKWVQLDTWWAVHRHVLYEHGVLVAGPALQTLVDRVTPDELRDAMAPLLADWLPEIRQDSAEMASRGYQCYIVLTLCRILYTLAQGDVTSKAAAARWARDAVPSRWVPLIDDAWEGRHASGGAPSALIVQETLGFIRFTVERGTLDYASDQSSV